MDPANYFVTTLVGALTKLTPYVIFIAAGYFLFIKMPFLFFRKSIKKQREKNEQDLLTESIHKSLKISAIKAKKPEQKKAEKEAPKKPEKVSPTSMPEEVFNFKTGESFTQAELKKRYFNKLKENHPDRVASMGEDFKKLAEKNTKEINLAYDKLKKKAS